MQDRTSPLADATEAADEPQAQAATKSVLSPKAGILWHLPRLVSLYASLSRGFRDPDRIIEQPDQPFITEWAYETGIKLDAPWGEASLSAFRMDVSNEQTFNPITLATTSGGASRRRGLELQGAVHPHPWLGLSADWTLNDAKYLDFITESGDTLGGRPIFNTARYVGSASIDLAPPRGSWNVRLATNAVGPYTPFDEPDTRLSPYALLHLSGGVTVAGAHVELGIRNLLDRHYPELRAGGFVSPGDPRAFYLTLSHLWR